MDKLVEVLRDFKLSDYEIKVLLTLISEGELTASEIAEKSGIPRTSVYETVKSLEKKGLVVCRGKPLRVRALSAEQLVNVFAKKLEEKMRALDKLTEIEKEKREEIVTIYRNEAAFNVLENILEKASRIVVASLNIDERLKKILDSKNAKKVIKIREFENDFSHAIILADDKAILYTNHEGDVTIIVGGGEFSKFYFELLSAFIKDLPFDVKK
ncbi:TrmB family transcriptional regulator [Ferroglobus placidus]|uniref:TrmB family transcriptional regulator n=1 Tax=Ferroglobus placidus TaxID=54261 RepID=UPI00069496F5|nr:helix-turn-helix domain-containing protein [Ferroglobus placidus]